LLLETGSDTMATLESARTEAVRGLVTRGIDPNNLRPLFAMAAAGRDVLRLVRQDTDFIWRLRRALLPLPFEREPAVSPEVFAPLERRFAPAFAGRRVAVVASGGSGALSSLVGVQRAFEEAGIEPVAISASSAAVLFALPWACGADSEAIARFWLTLPRAGYLDPEWSALPRALLHAFREWTGLLRGEALEKSFRQWFGDRRLGETRIPFSLVVWNIDLNRVEYIGTRETPDLPVAVAARVSIAIPIFVQPVRLGGHLYADGGIVDVFPLRPVLSAKPDVILGVNCYLPQDFAGENLSGWHEQSFAVLRASSQLRFSGMLALAREQARLAGDRLSLLHPVPYSEVRGARFYDTFLDRSRWPVFMREGLRVAREKLFSGAEARASA
jgi:NTE family protein